MICRTFGPKHVSTSARRPASPGGLSAFSACQLSPAQALADYRRTLEALAGSHVHVGDVDQGNTGREGLLYALGEDLGGDARIGEVAV
jgi:hypothetical protein